MVDARGSRRRNGGLGVIGDAETSGLDHCKIVGAVAHHQRVDGIDIETLGEIDQRRELRLAPQNRLTRLRRSACRSPISRMFARFSLKPMQASR